MRARLLYSVCDQTFPVFVFPPLPPALRAESERTHRADLPFPNGLFSESGPEERRRRGKEEDQFFFGRGEGLGGMHVVRVVLVLEQPACTL